MQKKSIDRDAARRRVILDAARDCILKFGYAKCSLEDIAKQAATRPLIYRKFKTADPEQLVRRRQSPARPLGVESQELLTKSKVFQNKILAGPEGAEQPA